VEIDKATELLAAERKRVEQLIRASSEDARSDREAEDETGDIDDPAERLTAEGLDDAVLETLRQRLDAISRAEARIKDGTYGRSVRSGQPIPDARLEADPAAELTVAEAEESALS
jgi:DnaK suppressor protein